MPVHLTAEQRQLALRLAVDERASRRVAVAFDELAIAI